MTREIDINGKVTVSIDSDSQEFADKVFAALSAIDRQQAVLLKNANTEIPVVFGCQHSDSPAD